MCEYPSRPSYFAQRFIRLLTKTAAAQELGPAACWMLAIIASQEDAKRYTEPAKWYYEQLMPLCGFRSSKQLRAAIQASVEQGWLHYRPGRKGKPCYFWVSIPERYTELDAGGCDESPAERVPSAETKRATKNGKGTLSGNESAVKAQRKGHASIPSPIPSPKESHSRRSFDPLSVDLPQELDRPMFRAAWADWCEHRLEIRKKQTPTSTAKQLTRLAEMGQSRAIQAIEHSIAQGWQGIREPDQAREKEPGKRPELRRFDEVGA